MSNREGLVNEVKKFFCIQELVSQRVFNRWGDLAWKFLDEKLLQTLLVIRRDILQVPLVCNDWRYGGKNHQRGLRENVAPLVKDKTDKGVMYLSAHILGKAVDLVSAKMDAYKMRELIDKNSFLLPYPVRIEQGVNWLHIDVMTNIDVKDTITWFKD